MTTAADIVRAAIPNADDAMVEHVLWGRTPAPIGRGTARSIYRAAAGLGRAGRNGRRLCDFCHREAKPETWYCVRCDGAWRVSDE